MIGSLGNILFSHILYVYIVHSSTLGCPLQVLRDHKNHHNHYGHLLTSTTDELEKGDKQQLVPNRTKQRQARKKKHKIYSGWWLTHPSEKYDRQKWEFSPRIGVNIKRYLKPPPSILLGVGCLQWIVSTPQVAKQGQMISWFGSAIFGDQFLFQESPIWSMGRLYINLHEWLIFMGSMQVNILYMDAGEYTIHGCYMNFYWNHQIKQKTLSPRNLSSISQLRNA